MAEHLVLFQSNDHQAVIFKVKKEGFEVQAFGLNNTALHDYHQHKAKRVEKFLRNKNINKQFFDTFKAKYDEYCLFENIDFNDLRFHSLVNFFRYYKELLSYFRRYSVVSVISNGLVSVIIRTADNLSTQLQLIFDEDGITRFIVSDEDDIHEDEDLIFAIEGNFSSSNLLEKSYKIRKLLSILDYQLCGSSKDFFFNRKIPENMNLKTL